jgi:hypothetical protein
MLNRIKKSAFYREFRKTNLFEMYLDVSLYLIERKRSVIKTNPIWKSQDFDGYCQRNKGGSVGVIFFCGLGDFLYGIPALLRMKEICTSTDNRFIAYVPSETNRFSNGTLNKLLSSLNIFDEVKPYVGYSNIYWKLYFWEELLEDELNHVRIYPFVYKTNRNIESRSDSVSNNFRLGNLPKLSECSLLESPAPHKNVEIKKLKEFVSRNPQGETVLFHSESRSADYRMSGSDEVIKYLISKKVKVIFAGTSNLNDKSLFVIDPNKTPLFDLMLVLKEVQPKVIAINSVFWPISELLNLKTLALHFLKSDDGHQFFHHDMTFITSSEYSHRQIQEKQGESQLLRENVHFTTSHNSPFIIEFKNDFLNTSISKFLMKVS